MAGHASARWYERLPLVGPWLQEALHPDEVTYRRYGERDDRVRRLRAQGLSVATIATGVVYLLWVLDALNPAHPIVGALFFTSEAACLLLFVVASASLWRLRFKPAASPEPERAVDVDVFVAVCGEPLNVVARTLHAVANIRWRGTLRPYVLDDGGSDDVRALAERLGFGYLSRAASGVERRDAKAGNLNFGLARSGGEYVLVLDADQVPRPEIVEALAGYLRFPRVAFVQSRQHYLVPEGDPFFNQDGLFYGAVQLAMDHHDTVIACGSGVLYRRAALDDLGGFATWNLVEDLTTSYELHARGWKSLYYPYPLSEGLAPDDILGVYRQRGQWALDTLRLFFWSPPLLKRGLPWRKRLNYFLIGLSYLCAGFFIPLLFCIPPWSYVTGHTVLRRPELEFVLFRGVYFVAMASAVRFLSRGEGAGRQFQMLVGIFPVYIRAALRALWYRHTKPAYHANNRARARGRLPVAFAVLPQLVLVAANLFLPIYAALAGTAPPRVIAANAIVSTVAVWTLWGAVEAALGIHDWQPERHPMQFYGPLEAR